MSPVSVMAIAWPASTRPSYSPCYHHVHRMLVRYSAGIAVEYPLFESDNLPIPVVGQKLPGDVEVLINPPIGRVFQERVSPQTR